MVVFQAAQPALLYLVPGVLISSISCALYNGKVNHLWEFDEEIEMKALGNKTK